MIERTLLENFRMTSSDLSSKVSVYKGDIALLEVDAIVSPTDKYMNGGTGGKQYCNVSRVKS